MLIQLVAQILVCLPPKCHKTSKIKEKKRCWQWVWYLVTSSLYKIICFVDNKMGLLKLYLCNHSLMANLLILSNLIKHSYIYQKASLFRLFFKTFSMVISMKDPDYQTWPKRVSSYLFLISLQHCKRFCANNETEKTAEKTCCKYFIKGLLTCWSWRLWGDHFLNQILEMCMF